MVLKAKTANEVSMFSLQILVFARGGLTALYHEDLQADAVRASQQPTPYLSCSNLSDGNWFQSSQFPRSESSHWTQPR